MGVGEGFSVGVGVRVGVGVVVGVSVGMEVGEGVGVGSGWAQAAPMAASEASRPTMIHCFMLFPCPERRFPFQATFQDNWASGAANTMVLTIQ